MRKARKNSFHRRDRLEFILSWSRFALKSKFRVFDFNASEPILICFHADLNKSPNPLQKLYKKGRKHPERGNISHRIAACEPEIPEVWPEGPIKRAIPNESIQLAAEMFVGFVCFFSCALCFVIGICRPQGSWPPMVRCMSLVPPSRNWAFFCAEFACF